MIFWKHKYIKYTILLIATILFFALINNPKREKNLYYTHNLSKDTLNCSIALDQTLKSSGHTIGYLYEIFRKFQDNQGCEIRISIDNNLINQWDKLNNGEIDMLIINSIKDSVPSIYQDNVISSASLNANEDVCVVTKDNYKIIQVLNHWLTYYMQTPEFLSTTKNYYKKSIHYISPYDNLIKQYSKVIGWDWRLLAALIYQESKFKVGVSSSRGAIGLMQINKTIANQFGIDDIYDPEQNIIAGVKHIKRLQDMYRKKGVDSTNIILITLAAYNCGEGRIADCMKVAETEGKNPLIWEDIENIIPLMSGKEFLRREDIKLGEFRGKETIKYVDRIIEKYEIYQNTVADN